MKLNTSQVFPGENALQFSSQKDGWVQNLVTRVSASGYEFTAPLALDLRLTKLEPDFYLKGTLGCHVIQPCARCAESFELKINHRFEIAFSKLNSRRGKSRFENNTGSTSESTAEMNEVDINFIEGNEIDLSPVIEEQFFLAIPFQSVCQESCKGMCQRCGANLNKGRCDCKVESKAIAFSDLGILKV